MSLWSIAGIAVVGLVASLWDFVDATLDMYEVRNAGIANGRRVAAQWDLRRSGLHLVAMAGIVAVVVGSAYGWSHGRLGALGVVIVLAVNGLWNLVDRHRLRAAQ